MSIFNRILSAICSILFAALTVCVLWQVFSRYVLASPSTGTDEAARFLFIWLSLLGAALTFGQKGHLAMDLMVSRLSGARARVVALVIELACLVFIGAVLLWGGSQLVLKTLASGQTSPALLLPMGLVYLAVPLSGAIMAVFAVCHMRALPDRIPMHESVE